MNSLLTESERDYMEAMRQEFGEAWGCNRYIGGLPPVDRVKTRPLSSLSEREKEQILSMRQRGIPYRQIEGQFRITSVAIWQLQQEHGYGWQFGRYIGGGLVS